MSKKARFNIGGTAKAKHTITAEPAIVQGSPVVITMSKWKGGEWLYDVKGPLSQHARGIPEAALEAL